MSRLPQSPEEKRAAKAASQRRWRQKKAQRELVEQHVKASVGLGERPRRPLPDNVSRADLAEIVRDMTMQGVLTGDLDLANKDHVPGINAGLKAQVIIDKREQNAQKSAFAELGRGLLSMLLGETPARPALSDGTIIDGEAVEVGEAD